MHKRIVNIINFIRGQEPRNPDADLFLPVYMQIQISKKHKLPTTFLLQYDAMMREDFRSLFLKEHNDYIETGVWLENCRALIEKIGLEWKGRCGYDWDWHVNIGFLEGYTPKQRIKIIDEVFRYYKSIFGEYPSVVGSWLIDAFSMKYMVEKYHVKGFCICREQYAIDAYTLWGGYSNGGYYPSKYNMLCPADKKKNQIDAPVFRMLGIDPIYGYDEHKYYRGEGFEGCFTIEPYGKPGKDKDIVDWYFKEYFTNDYLSFSHITIGQENSFSWDSIKEGYETQINKLIELNKKGIISFEKFSNTCANFINEYKKTPPQTLIALSDWGKTDLKSIWYNSYKYRSNLFLIDKKLFFRDITFFNDEYKERYLNRRCTSWDAVYDNLPIVDSRLWSSNIDNCYLLFKKEVNDINTETENNNLIIHITFNDGSKGKIVFKETAICFYNCGDLLYFLGNHSALENYKVNNQKIEYRHRKYNYSIKIDANIQKMDNNLFLIHSRKNMKIIF